MKIYLKKHLNGLYPVYTSDHSALEKIANGETVEATIRQDRNVKHHAKFFAILEMCYKNQEYYNNKDVFRGLVQREAGYYEEVRTKNGIERWPKSIAFDKMSQDEFEELYEKCLQVLARLFDTDPETLENNATI